MNFSGAMKCADTLMPSPAEPQTLRISFCNPTLI